MIQPKKSVLTIATGNPIYIKMAVSLARSFKVWHKNSSIQFSIATDQKDLIPADLLDLNIVEVSPGQLGSGFSPKLHLDTLAPAENTLFVDADCLCCGSLEPAFEKFSGKAVSVIGKKIFDGNFFGDVEAIRRQFKIDYMPYFVGGVYYIEKGETSTKIYQKARALEKQYDDIGLVRLRGKQNEEPLISIAMSIYGQTPIREDGTIKSEPIFYPSGMSIDVLGGKAVLHNLPNASFCKTWGVTKSEPAIVHFHCSNAERSPYTREVLILEKVFQYGWNFRIARFYAYWKITVPQHVSDNLKETFRPLYRFLFGVRKIQKSRRISDASH